MPALFPLDETNCYNMLSCQGNNLSFAGNCDAECSKCDYSEKLTSQACLEETRYTCTNNTLAFVNCSTGNTLKRFDQERICQDVLCGPENNYTQYSYLYSLESNTIDLFTPTQRPTTHLQAPTDLTLDDSTPVLELTSPPLLTARVSAIALTILLAFIFLVRHFLCSSSLSGPKLSREASSSTNNRRTASAASLDSGIEMLLRGEYGDSDYDDDDDEDLIQASAAIDNDNFL